MPHRLDRARTQDGGHFVGRFNAACEHGGSGWCWALEGERHSKDEAHVQHGKEVNTHD
jgi:hypothetical protein